MRLRPTRCGRHLGSQRLSQLRQKGGFPFVFPDGLEGDAVDTGAPLVGTDTVIGMTEDVCPADLVVQGVEVEGRFLLALR